MPASEAHQASPSSRDAPPSHHVHNGHYYYRPSAPVTPVRPAAPQAPVSNQAVLDLQRSVAAATKRHHTFVNSTGIVDGTNKLTMARRGMNRQPPRTASPDKKKKGKQLQKIEQPQKVEQLHKVEQPHKVEQQTEPTPTSTTSSKPKPSATVEKDIVVPASYKPRVRSNTLRLEVSPHKLTENPRDAVGDVDIVTVSQPSSAKPTKAELAKESSDEDEAHELTPLQEESPTLSPQKDDEKQAD